MDRLACLLFFRSSLASMTEPLKEALERRVEFKAVPVSDCNRATTDNQPGQIEMADSLSNPVVVI